VYLQFRREVGISNIFLKDVYKEFRSGMSTAIVRIRLSAIFALIAHLVFAPTFNRIGIDIAMPFPKRACDRSTSLRYDVVIIDCINDLGIGQTACSSYGVANLPMMLTRTRVVPIPL